MLRGDVAPDAFRASATPWFGWLDYDGHRHSVGAHVDFEILVRRAEADLRLGERAAGGHTEGRNEIDDVSHLRQLRQLRAHLERHLRQTLHDEVRKPLDRLGDDDHAEQAADGGRRNAPVDRPGPAFLRIDVPARATLEPGAARRREPSWVALALKRCAHEDLRAVGRELEIEAGSQGLVAEAQLHHLRLDDDTPALEKGEQIARVLAANIDSDATWPLVFEAGEEANGLAIRRGVLILSNEERARQERDTGVRVEQGDGQCASAAAGVPRARARSVRHLLYLQAVFDVLGLRRHGFREPRVDARTARHEAACGQCRVLRGLHGARPCALAAPAFALYASDVHGAAVDGVVHTVRRRLRRLAAALRAPGRAAQ